MVDRHIFYRIGLSSLPLLFYPLHPNARSAACNLCAIKEIGIAYLCRSNMYVSREPASKNKLQVAMTEWSDALETSITASLPVWKLASLLESDFKSRLHPSTFCNYLFTPLRQANITCCEPENSISFHCLFSLFENRFRGRLSGSRILLVSYFIE